MPANNVTIPHYHLWTDALHARELARQAANRWDRGTYVRWAVTTAWTVLEMACNDALAVSNIGYSFRKNLDAACAANGITVSDWGQGLWQRVATLQEARKEFAHINADQKRLFAEVPEAERAIVTVRDAAKDIYTRAGKTPPAWLDYDTDGGWDAAKRSGAFSTTLHAGAEGEALEIRYEYKGREHVSDRLPPDTPEPELHRLIDDLLHHRMNVPVTAVRVYRGTELVLDQPCQMRGN